MKFWWLIALWFFYWFNNCFIGLISLLLRVVWALIVAILFIGRIDQPAVQRYWELRDAGYNTYLGFLALEEANSHSILISSIQMFLSGEAGKKYRERVKNGLLNLEHKSAVRSRSEIVKTWLITY